MMATWIRSQRNVIKKYNENFSDIDSQNLEKSLCAKDKTINHCWIPVIFTPSVKTVVKTGMILSW